MLTSPCATYVVSVKKNIVILTVHQKHIYIIDIIMFIYSPKSVIGFFGLFVHITVIVNFKCAMENGFPEINMRG